MVVLIAEDNVVSRLITQKSVEKSGHQAVLADNGLRAWHLFCQSRPQVVISDLRVPELSGRELCERVRAHDGPYTYFMILTSLAERQEMLRCIAAGADEYLNKPVEREQLEARLVVAGRLTSYIHELYERAGRRPPGR